jgi:2-oxoglutarate ferredoxin oxidoreductase subunit alpha
MGLFSKKQDKEPNKMKNTKPKTKPTKTKKVGKYKANGFSFKIGGEAGYGIMSAGVTFSKIASRSGYHVFDYSEYPSIVRGGHNVMQTTVSSEPTRSQLRHTDFLVALNQETVDLHKNELIQGSGILFDSQQGVKIKDIPKGVKLYDVPINKIAREVGGSEIMRNTAAMGATMAALGGKLQHLKDLIKEEFAHKKPEVVKKNHETCQAGYDYVMKNFKSDIIDVLKPKSKTKPQMVLNGNEAIALGAIAGGMQFAAIYPMTPISGILHTLSPLQEKFKFIYKQPEDEISAINMAIGASFAGARSMTASGGGGFCLMTEAYGLAGITETPLVIIEGMRGAPATGLPTWTEQGDLRFVLHAHQGDFPRIVLAAGDIDEAFNLTMEAFNLAEKYQTPVLILVDKQVLESHKSTTPFNFKNYKINRGKLITKRQSNYERYGLEDDGISYRSIPGVGNHFVANSDEHNKIGYSNEGAENRCEQMEKRMKKLEICAKTDMAKPRIYGPEDAELTLVSWGSNKGAILDAIREFDNVNYMHITWMNPFPADYVAEVLYNAKDVINIECNYTAQMGGLIREKTGIKINDNLLKYNGRPFFPEEIVEKIKSVL